MIDGEPIRTVAPTAPAVELDAALEHARLGSSPKDLGAVLSMLEAATEAIENYTGLGLITQTWRQTWSAFPSELLLRRRPVQAVTITYLDEGGELQMLDAADYITAGVGGAKFNATVRAASTWPSTYSHPEAVSVAYTVGFGDSPADVPDLIRHAVLLVFGAFYEFRENVTAEPVAELPVASKALLRDWRPLAVA